MSAKPFFKEQVGWARSGDGWWDISGDSQLSGTTRVRITDHRRPSALRVAERIFQIMLRAGHGLSFKDAKQAIEQIAEAAGMTANVRAGLVKCDWKKEATK